MKEISTADRLKQIMNERGLKQVDILEACKPYCIKYNVKLNKNDLSQYVSGKVIPKQDKLSILAMALKVNEVWLMGYDVPMERDAPSSSPFCSQSLPDNIIPLPKPHYIPLVGTIACGEPLLRYICGSPGRPPPLRKWTALPCALHWK